MSKTHTVGSGTTPSALSLRNSFQVLLPTLLIDIVLPYTVYLTLHRLGMDNVSALTAGACIPLVRAIIGVVRDRRIDGLALLVLMVFAVGICTSFVTGDARFALAKDSAFTGVIGISLLGSLFIGRPVAFYGLCRFAPGEDPGFWERRWQQSKGFRRGLRLMTTVWATGLLLEAAVRVLAAYTLPVSTAALLSPILVVTVFAALGCWSGIYGRRARARREATCGE